MSIVDELSMHPQVDARELIASSNLEQRNLETPLLRMLPRAVFSEQAAILRLLAVCGTQRSVPPLMRLARQGGHQEEAIATLAQVVGVKRLPQLVRSSADRDFRANLIRRLLVAEPEASLLDYLSLVHDESTRTEALAVAKAAPTLPTDALFVLLDDSNPSGAIFGRAGVGLRRRTRCDSAADRPRDQTAGRLAGGLDSPFGMSRRVSGPILCLCDASAATARIRQQCPRPIVPINSITPPEISKCSCN